MPELPEVETMAAVLREDFLGQSLARVRVFDRGALRATTLRAVKGMRGGRLIGLTRRGKFLLLHLSNGSILLFHLKMTGRLALREGNGDREPWERIRLEFAESGKRLSFIDPRKFGYLAVMPPGSDCPVPLMYELGPDALRVSRRELREILGSSRRPIKALLLDQRALAGLGNIYVDECLHRAGIHPCVPAQDVEPERVHALHGSLRRVLRQAIKCGGSSVRTFRDMRGASGTFQDHHRVYGKKGERCRRCHSIIEYTRVASRGTHFCPACQAPP